MPEPLVGVVGVVPALPLDVVGSLGKGRHQVAGPVQPRAAPAMVEMQMGQDNGVDVLGGQPCPAQALHQSAWHQSQTFLVLVAVLGAHSRVHQDIFPAYLEQQAVQPQGDAVLPVGIDRRFPVSLGYLPKN